MLNNAPSSPAHESLLTLKFDGYWREAHLHEIPEAGGVYCVYACTHLASSHTLTLRRLLYIGESHRVHTRIQQHERKPEWRHSLAFSEVLCFSFAAVGEKDRVLCEQALVSRFRPPLNLSRNTPFHPLHNLHLRLVGQIGLLSPEFVIPGREG